MKTTPQSLEEIRKVTNTLVNRRLWAEELLARVHVIMRTRGNERLRELHQLELAIRLEMDETKVTKPLYHFIWDNSERLREVLLSRHRTLSANDLFLCACIQAGVSISDVAAIKDVAPSTISMNRYRLKKKIGLHAHEDLEVYIHNCNHAN